MKPRSRNRLLALLLSAAMVAGLFPTSALAVEADCTHQHDQAVCGYKEAVEGASCSLVHPHDDTCGWAEAAGASPCAVEAAHTAHDENCGGDPDTGAGCTFLHEHDGSCGYAPARDASPCAVEANHVHDPAVCGYIEAVTGHPCNHVHDDACGGLTVDSGTTSGNNPPALVETVETAPGTVEPEDAGTIRVMAFDELGGGVKVQTVPKGTELESLTLPVTLGASGYTVSADTEPVPEPITITGVMWELTGENNSPTVYEDGRETPCSYYFQPVLPEGYKLADSAELPKIEVRYGWGTRANTSSYNTEDEAAFKQLLTDHPELKSVTGVVEDNPASWQTAGLVTWNATTNRLVTLDLSGKSLTGTLDVSGLPKLATLLCSDNASLTGLTLGQHDDLTDLRCSNTGISGTLDVSGFPKLATLLCYDNASLTGLTLGQHDDLTYLRCYNTGISGTLDV